VSRRNTAVLDALRGLRDAPGGDWVTDGVIDRVFGLVAGCDLMHLAEGLVMDALDAEPTYPGEGKDWHIAAIMRARSGRAGGCWRVFAGQSGWAWAGFYRSSETSKTPIR
jgi:hypothetical protein